MKEINLETSTLDGPPYHQPAQSRHCLNTVEERRVLTGVVIALIIPSRNAVH